MASNEKSIMIRWVTVLIFPLVGILTWDILHQYQLELLLNLLISLVFSVLLLNVLKNFNKKSWPIWITYSVFLIGYFLKFIWLVDDAKSVTRETQIFSIERLSIAADPLNGLIALSLSTLGYVIFCLCAIYSLSKKDFRSSTYTKLAVTTKRIVQPIVLIAIAALIITTYVAIQFDLLSAAVVNERLPFRLGGWISYIRQSVIPCLSVFIMLVGFTFNKSILKLIGISIILALASTDVIITTTRSAILFAGLYIAFAAILGGQKWSKKMAISTMSFICATCILWPIVSEYRNLRSVGREASLDNFLESLSSTSSNDDTNLLLDGAKKSVARIVGIDGLMFVADEYEMILEQNTWELITTWNNLGEFFTRAVAKYPFDAPHSEAPSLVGWFFIFGRYWGLLLLFPFFLIQSFNIWQRLLSSKSHTNQVSQVYFLVLWIKISSDGTMDNFAIGIIASVATILFLENWCHKASRN